MATYTLTATAEAPEITVTYPNDFDRYWSLRTVHKLTVRDALKHMSEERWLGWIYNDYTDYMTLARFRKLEILVQRIKCNDPWGCKCPRCN
jgi:hypothetical protein